MLNIVRGNLILSDVEALVNTVNCSGYMGKGIALQFKRAFPENFKFYEKACRAKEVRPGQVLVFKTSFTVNPRYIINFPTKDHWRGKSRIEDIDAGLKSLVSEILRLGIKSIAVPPLGCGLGGLNWYDVKPRIQKAFESIPDTQVVLFEPAGAPSSFQISVKTQKPRMTIARALLICLMKKYLELACRLTLLEIQKLAYFLQEAGEPLRLNYEKGHYGPYAHNLNKVLEALDGHFIQGYGNSFKPDVEIILMHEATDIARAFIEAKHDSRYYLVKVSELISGFETPYGMELLSSVHWVATKSECTIKDGDQVVTAIHGWNDRKRRMFKDDHIVYAWKRLVEYGWLT